MTNNIKLLPLPEGEASSFGDYQVHDNEAMIEYARANVARAVAPLQAEIDALRRELEEWKNVAEAHAGAADEAEAHAEELAKALAELITWIPSADTYRRLGFDPEAPMQALKRAKLSIGSIRGLSNEQRR